MWVCDRYGSGLSLVYGRSRGLLLKCSYAEYAKLVRRMHAAGMVVFDVVPLVINGEPSYGRVLLGSCGSDVP